MTFIFWLSTEVGTFLSGQFPLLTIIAPRLVNDCDDRQTKQFCLPCSGIGRMLEIHLASLDFLNAVVHVVQNQF